MAEFGIQKASTEVVYLIELRPVHGERIYLGSSIIDVELGSSIYKGGSLSRVSSAGHDLGLQNQNASFEISDNSPQWLGSVLNGDFIGASVIILLGAGRNQTTGYPFILPLFQGTIDSIEIDESDGVRRLIFLCENIAHLLNKSNGAKHTDGFQRTIDPEDDSHSMVGKMANKDLTVKR